MIRADKTLLLYIIILIEGYAVLSAEMLAIRQTIPFTGSGTDTISIIIAAVLMPLAFGYYAGGRYRSAHKKEKKKTIRNKLLFNIIVAQFILMIGLSHAPLLLFFTKLIDIGLKHRIIQISLYSALFLVTPVFLLGQTIPLVSNFFHKKKLAHITGIMLFFSTMGSFLGAVFSTLFLMAFIGVHYTVVVLSGLLTVLVVLLSRKRLSDVVFISIAITGIAFIANSTSLMRFMYIVEDNQYNTVMVFQDKDLNRHMVLNRTGASMYNDNGNKHEYIQFIERAVLDAIRDGDQPRDILVIGTGAFTFGLEDRFNNYDFVDIDKSLKKISEDYILRQKLRDNKKFNVMDARAYLMGTEKKYDLILLDVCNGDLTLPEHLATQEFYKLVRKHLKPNGVVTANFVTSAGFEDAFSRTVDNTFRSVFPYVSRYVIQNRGAIWVNDPALSSNIIYVYRHNADENTTKVYTDNINTIFYDKPHSR